MLSYISLTEAIEPLRQIEQARHYFCIQSLASTRLAVRCEGKNRLLVLWSSGPLVLWSSSALQVISLSEQTDIFRFSQLSKGLDVIRFADVVL